MKKEFCRIAIFASGNGTNAEAIINYLEGKEQLKVTRIYSNNSDAFVLERAKNHGIPSTTFTRQEFYDDLYIDSLLSEETDLIVLAGFMWLVPPKLVKAYPNKIINIHPALLPKFGGKGMYGHHVHEAVLAKNERESGITIHFVNEKYDDGNIILQKSCPVMPEDTPDSLAERVHALEHEFYPIVVEDLCKKILG